MKDFIFDNPTFSALLCLFLIEQVFYYIMGSYPYRYGIPIRKLPLSSASELISKSERIEEKSLAMKVITGRSEMYFHDRNPFGVIAPQFFLGQVTLEGGGTAFIRIGPLTGLFMVFLVLASYKEVISGVLIVILLIWRYSRFIRNSQKIIERTQA